MAENAPELGPAVSQLVEAVRKGGANTLMWVVMALVGAAPVAIQQINANRGPGSVEYLNQADFQVLGPERAEPGTLVRLTVADYDPSDVCWFTVGDSQKYGSNGAELVFSMPNEPAVVTCSIIRRGELYLTQKTVGISEASPVEPKEPKVTVEPKEPKPEALSEIAEKIIKLAKSSGLSSRDAEQVAKNLEKAADESEGKNPRSLVMRTVELNDDLELDEEVTEGIQVLLQTLAEEGSLQTMQQHLDTWRDMAKGFKKYAE